MKMLLKACKVGDFLSFRPQTICGTGYIFGLEFIKEGVDFGWFGDSDCISPNLN